MAVNTLNLRDTLSEKVLHYLKGECTEGRDSRGNIIYKPTYSPNNIKSLFIFPDHAFVVLHKTIQNGTATVVSLNPVDIYKEYKHNAGLDYKKDNRGNWIRNIKTTPVYNLQGLIRNKAQNLENIFIFSGIDVDVYMKSYKEQAQRQLVEQRKMMQMTQPQRDEYMSKRDMNEVDFKGLIQFYSTETFGRYVLQGFYNCDTQANVDNLKKDFPRLRTVLIIPNISYKNFAFNDDLKKAFNARNLELIAKTNAIEIYKNEEDITKYIFSMPSTYVADNEIKDYLESLKTVAEEKVKTKEVKKNDDDLDEISKNYEKEVNKFKKYYALYEKFTRIVITRGYSNFAEIQLSQTNLASAVPELYKTKIYEKVPRLKNDDNLSKKEQMQYNIVEMAKFEANSYTLLLKNFIDNIAVYLTMPGWSESSDLMLKTLIKDCDRALVIPNEEKMAVDSLLESLNLQDAGYFTGSEVRAKDSYCNLLTYLSKVFVKASQYATDKEYWLAVYNGTLAQYNSKDNNKNIDSKEVTE